MGNGQMLDLRRTRSNEDYAIDEMPMKTIIDESRLRNIGNCKKMLGCRFSNGIQVASYIIHTLESIKILFIFSNEEHSKQIEHNRVTHCNYK